MTAATINRELRRRGVAERITQGKGYVYFRGGDATSWVSASIPTCYVRDLFEATLDETIQAVLAERERLRTRER